MNHSKYRDQQTLKGTIWVLFGLLCYCFSTFATDYQLESKRINQRGSAEFLTGPNAGQPLDTALDFIDEKLAALGLTATDIAEFTVSDQYVSRTTGTTHIYFSQNYRGIEVFGSSMNIHLTDDGKVISLASNFVGSLNEAVAGRVTLTAIQALEAAAESLDLTLAQPVQVRSVATGDNQRTLLSDAGISRAEIPAHLVYQPVAADRLRLAWNLELKTLDGHHHWNVRIDAETGEPLSKNDYMIEDSFAMPAQKTSDIPEVDRGTTQPVGKRGATEQYEVFAMPIEYPYDGPRTIVSNPADPIASPFGWHDTDGSAGAEFTITRGNNTHAFLDRDNNNAPDPGADVDGGPDLDFTGALVPLDLGQDPSTYTNAAVTNLFYWVNTIHDVFYHYGFDEQAGNFQVNNYGNGGVGGDDVIAYAQKGANVGIFNNAFFGTPPDGSRPEMLMHLFNITNPNRDGDFASGIITHEFGHGVSNRLTGGPSNVSCLGNAEHMGEGWSDFLGLVVTAVPTDADVTIRGPGVYVLGQPIDGNGVRPAPYTTNMAANGFTYGNIPGQGSHTRGFIWCTMLWEVYWGLVNEHGFNPDFYGDYTTGGNNLAIQLVMDGMKLQPCRPGFVDGRDAILLADMNLTGGENQCIIWEAFAKRGLGFSADQGSSNSSSDGTEAFDVPECNPTCDNLLLQLPNWGTDLTILDLIPCIEPPR